MLEPLSQANSNSARLVSLQSLMARSNRFSDTTPLELGAHSRQCNRLSSRFNLSQDLFSQQSDNLLARLSRVDSHAQAAKEPNPDRVRQKGPLEAPDWRLGSSIGAFANHGEISDLSAGRNNFRYKLSDLFGLRPGMRERSREGLPGAVDGAKIQLGKREFNCESTPAKKILQGRRRRHLDFTKESPDCWLQHNVLRKTEVTRMMTMLADCVLVDRQAPTGTGVKPDKGPLARPLDWRRDQRGLAVKMNKLMSISPNPGGRRSARKITSTVSIELEPSLGVTGHVGKAREQNRPKQASVKSGLEGDIRRSELDSLKLDLDSKMDSSGRSRAHRQSGRQAQFLRMPSEDNQFWRESVHSVLKSKPSAEEIASQTVPETGPECVHFLNFTRRRGAKPNRLAETPNKDSHIETSPIGTCDAAKARNPDLDLEGLETCSEKSSRNRPSAKSPFENVRHYYFDPVSKSVYVEISAGRPETRKKSQPTRSGRLGAQQVRLVSLAEYAQSNKIGNGAAKLCSRNAPGNIFFFFFGIIFVIFGNKLLLKKF